jgi:hypothetical protein
MQVLAIISKQNLENWSELMDNNNLLLLKVTNDQL